MAKVRNLSDTQQQIAFTEHDFYQRYVETFKTSELGRIKSLLPLHEMAIPFGLIEKANLAYRKQRKHTHKQTRKMIMRLLALLGKILGEIRRQMRVHPNEGLLNDKQLDVVETITRVYRQQKNHFKSGDSRESIPNRIVSISKPYVRPSSSCSLMFYAWNATLREWLLQT